MQKSNGSSTASTRSRKSLRSIVTAFQNCSARIKLLYLMRIILMLFAVCVSAAIASAADVIEAVPYADGGTADQVLDFHWPGGTPKAAVLFIHGGSLQESGERRTSAAYANVCQPFVAENIACATIDYRLAPTHKWPAMPHDVAAAVRKVRQLIAARGVEAPLFLFGHSSGCHLAAIVGTDPKYLAQVGLRPSDIAGIIPMGCTLDRDDAAVRGLTAEKIRAAFS